MRCALLALLLVTGCKAKVLTPTAADEFRREVAQLKAELAEANRQVGELRSALAERPGTIADPAAAPFVPRLAEVTLGGHTGLEPVEGGCVLRAYMQPADGRGRFLQVTGTATVTLVMVKEGCEAQAAACRTFSPEEVRDAWRSGLMGAHYTFEIPVQDRAACEAGGIVRLGFVDALTGEVYEAHAAVAAGEAP